MYVYAVAMYGQIVVSPDAATQNFPNELVARDCF